MVRLKRKGLGWEVVAEIVGLVVLDGGKRKNFRMWKNDLCALVARTN